MYFIIMNFASVGVLPIYTVSQKRHGFGLLQLPRTSTDFNIFLAELLLRSKQSNGILFSHLT